MDLVFKNGRAVADNGDIGVTMLIVPKEDIDNAGVVFRYFEYVAAFSQPPVRVEWDIESMHAVLPKDAANLLVARKYARDMNEAEVTEYNKAGKVETTQPPVVETEASPVPEPAPPEKTEPAKSGSKKPKRGD
jgi:hypothetical protein